MGCVSEQGPRPIISLFWSKDDAHVMSEVDTGADMDIVLWDINASRYMKGIPHVPTGIEWNCDNILDDDDLLGELKKG